MRNRNIEIKKKKIKNASNLTHSNRPTVTHLGTQPLKSTAITLCSNQTLMLLKLLFAFTGIL